jgi:hypothetical protein
MCRSARSWTKYVNADKKGGDMAPNVPIKINQGELRPTTLFEGTFGFPLFQRLSRELR